MNYQMTEEEQATFDRVKVNHERKLASRARIRDAQDNPREAIIARRKEKKAAKKLKMERAYR